MPVEIGMFLRRGKCGESTRSLTVFDGTCAQACAASRMQ